MQKFKIIIKFILQILVFLFSYSIFDLFFGSYNEIKYLYILILIIIIVAHNIDNAKTLFNKSAKNMDKLFNVYYINYPKVFEICMLIDNKIKSQVEQKYKNEYLERQSSGLFGEIKKNPLKFGANISEEKSNTKTYEYRELQEIKNTNSTYLSLLMQKCKNKNLSELKNGDLIKIDDVKLEILNKDEIVQVNSMVSGVFNGNTIPTDSDGQTFNIDISSITNILLKDYKYHVICKKTDETDFYMSIPMKINNEFESNYSIYDLEIGKVNVIGIYRTSNYNYKENTSTFNLLQNLGESQQNDTGDQLISSTKTKANINKHDKSKEKPYIDLIAIIQDLDIYDGETNE
jgi:hypothetical protein